VDVRELRTGGMRWLVLVNERIVSRVSGGMYYEVEKSEEEVRAERKRWLELETWKRDRVGLREKGKSGKEERKEDKVESDEDLKEEEELEEEEDKWDKKVNEKEQKTETQKKELMIKLGKTKNVKVSNEYESGSIHLALKDMSVAKQVKSGIQEKSEIKKVYSGHESSSDKLAQLEVASLEHKDGKKSGGKSNVERRKRRKFQKATIRQT
jgi:hypothetical protein